MHGTGCDQGICASVVCGYATAEEAWCLGRGVGWGVTKSVQMIFTRNQVRQVGGCVEHTVVMRHRRRKEMLKDWQADVKKDVFGICPRSSKCMTCRLYAT